MNNHMKIKFAGVRILDMIERFRSEIRAVAAIEFAIIAPILILMFIGTLEISLAISVNRKVSRISSAVADLVTQSQTLTVNDLDAIMDVSSRIMFPYDGANTVSIVITGLDMTATSATVAWSRARNDTANTVGAAYSVPSAILSDGQFLVSAKVSTTHSPMMGWVSYSSAGALSFDGTPMDMEEELFLRPRIGSAVCINSC